MKRWTYKEIEYIKRNSEKLYITEISKKLNRTKCSIISKIKELKLNKKINFKFWTAEENNILIEYYGKTSIDNYQHLLNNRTYFAIGLHARSLNLKAEDSFTLKTNFKNKINHDFFKNINFLNSYWAGFIAADGAIKDRTCLSIELAIKDKQHLNTFIKNINFTGKITITKRNFALLQMYSYDIIENLKNNFNITKTKTFTLLPPNINRLEHKLSFICGLIDGDGCIYIGSKYLAINILGTKEMLLWVKETFEELFDTSKNHILKVKSIYSMSIHTKNVKILYDIIRNYNVPLLKRKWNKLEKFYFKSFIVSL